MGDSPSTEKKLEDFQPTHSTVELQIQRVYIRRPFVYLVVVSCPLSKQKGQREMAGMKAFSSPRKEKRIDGRRWPWPDGYLILFPRACSFIRRHPPWLDCKCVDYAVSRESNTVHINIYLQELSHIISLVTLLYPSSESTGLSTAEFPLLPFNRLYKAFYWNSWKWLLIAASTSKNRRRHSELNVAEAFNSTLRLKALGRSESERDMFLIWVVESVGFPSWLRQQHTVSCSFMILLTRTLRDAVQLPLDGAVVCQPYNRHYTSRCSFLFFFLFPQLPLFPLSLLFLFIASSTMSSFGDRFVSPTRLPADSYTSTVNHLEGIRHISTAIYDFNSISGAQRGNDVRIERPAIFGQKFLFLLLDCAT